MCIYRASVSCPYPNTNPICHVYVYITFVLYLLLSTLSSIFTYIYCINVMSEQKMTGAVGI